MTDKQHIKRQQSFRPIYTYLLSRGMQENLNRQDIIAYIGNKYNPGLAQKILDLWFGIDLENRINIYYKEDVAYGVACEDITELLAEDHKTLRDDNDSAFRYKENFNFAKVSSIITKIINKFINLIITLVSNIYGIVSSFVISIITILENVIKIPYMIYSRLGKIASIVLSAIILIAVLFYNMEGKFGTFGYTLISIITGAIILGIIFLNDYFPYDWDEYIGSGILGISALLYLNYYVITADEYKETHTYSSSTLPSVKKNRQEKKPISKPMNAYADNDVIVKNFVPEIQKENQDKILIEKKKDKKQACTYYQTSSRVNLRSGPNKLSSKLGTISKNKKVCITDKSMLWFYVKDKGWVYNKYLVNYKNQNKINKKKRKETKAKKRVDRSVWHCSAKSERASGWVERVGKQNAMNGALHQCKIRRQTSSVCRIVNCYKR